MLFTLLNASRAIAEEKSESMELFDGKTLKGWQGDKKYWSVEDGVICGKNKDRVPVSTYLVTDKSYREFRLTCQAKLVKSEMHSGIALWGALAPDKGDPFTYAGHLVMFPSEWGLYDLYGRNGLPVDNAPAKKAGKQHEWNNMELLAKGDVIKLAVNGQLVLTYNETEPNRIKEGPIGLQLHSNTEAQEVHFKDLVLETNPSDELKTLSKSK